MWIFTDILGDQEGVSTINLPTQATSRRLNWNRKSKRLVYLKAYLRVLGLINRVNRFTTRIPCYKISCVYSSRLGMIILFYNSILFIRGKSKDDKLPVKFGRYQRNILTFKQTIILGTLNAVLGLRMTTFLFIQSYMNLNNSHFFQLLVLSNIIFVDVMFMLVLPLFTLFNLHLHMPDFFKNSKEKKIEFCYIFPSMEPRRPLFSEEKEFIMPTKKVFCGWWDFW